MKYKKNTQKLVNGFSKKSKIVSRSIFQLGMVLNIILFNACESNVQITQIDGFTSSENL